MRPDDDGADEPLVPVAIPALVLLLHRAEQQEGRPLTEAEVLAMRDGAVCMMVPRSVRDEGAASRGYDDVDLDDPWPSWTVYRESLRG